MDSGYTCRGVLTNWTRRAFATSVLLATATQVAFAQGAAVDVQGRGVVSHLSPGEAFTFLFVTLGPLNVIGPFAAMTEGRSAFRRRLAFQASLVATVALVIAAALGAKTLQAWGISVGALLLTIGAILFLVALKPVLAGYDPPGARGKVSTGIALPAPSESELAFWPLAFPTIVTPYGLGLLILLLTVYPLGSGGLSILAAAAFVLVLDLLAMLCMGLIVKIPFIKPGLDILGAVMGVLLVALGVQAIADGLRLLIQ
jgi:multiple antibiotic resistance protein